jgi:hypothetical protein
MQQRALGYSIKIFVPDGDPDSLRFVSKTNWIGVGVVFNHVSFVKVVREPEIDRTGVYVLVGSSEDRALPLIYVGEGDPVKDRLKQHHSKKDFWDWAVFFVTENSSLNKAHVQYLECRLLELARSAKRCKLDNGTKPCLPTLTKSDVADMESFLSHMLDILPLVGLRAFEQLESVGSPTTILYLNAKGLQARGYEDAKGFVVCKDSQMVDEAVRSLDQYALAMRNDLKEQGVVARSGDHFVFTQDHPFTSPSKAGSVVTGRSTNGRTEWKTADGKTLGAIQIEAAERAT